MKEPHHKYRQFGTMTSLLTSPDQLIRLFPGFKTGKLPSMLDDCANVDEAIAKVDTAIVTPEDWQECHIFVSDAQDHYALIES